MYFNFIKKSIFYTEFNWRPSELQFVILFGGMLYKQLISFFKNYAHRVQIDVLLR